MKFIVLNLMLLTSGLPAATVRQVLGTASAPVNAVLPDGANFTTGKKSKSAVALPKGFFRVGSDTGVKVVTANNLSLEKGIMLAGSDPARFLRPAVTVNAPGYKMEIKGTAQIAYYPGSYVKITVLEGKIRVSLQSLTGEWETLEQGQMLIINPSDKKLPEPVEVDIGRLAATSQLIGGAFAELSTQDLITAAAASQAAAMAAGNLAETPLRLSGASPETALALTNRQANAANAVQPAEVTNFQLVNDLANPNATVNESSFAEGTPFALLPAVDDAGNLTITRSGPKTQKLNILLSSATDDFGQFLGPALINGNIRVDPDVFGGTPRTLEIKSSELGLSDAAILNDPAALLQIQTGSDIQSPTGVALNIIGGVGLTVTGARIQAGSGNAEPLLLAARTRNLTVTNSQLQGGQITLTGSTQLPAEKRQNISLDSSQLAAKRDIQIGSDQKQTFITLQNSTQLSALVGSITIQSKGGPISIDSSSLSAGGTITLDAFDAAWKQDSPMTLTNSTLSADIIRARGYSVAGDALIIDGSTFNAASMLKLYAEAASTLRFRNNVYLNTPLAILAGQTIRVDAGGQVQISGKGRVFTDHALFNTPGQGSLNAVGGLTTSPHKQRPRF